MTIASIMEQIDSEIASLQQAKALLLGSAAIKRGPGRPPMASKAVAKPRKKRKLTPEGRARIAAAVKARWAAQKKAAKVIAKKVPKKAGKRSTRAATPDAEEPKATI
jgi:hypothetical protein